MKKEENNYFRNQLNKKRKVNKKYQQRVNYRILSKKYPIIQIQI